MSEKEPIIEYPDFPPITSADLVEIERLQMRLLRKFQRGEDFHFPGFETYTIKGEGVGSPRIFFNTKITVAQLDFAMAMTRHPSLYKIIADPSITLENFNAEELMRNKIMSGMRILDLGSSDYPVFARCSRAMGANVWTVDLKLITESSFGEVEAAQHIRLNLDAPNAATKIAHITGGDFNLVTESQLSADGFVHGQTIAMPLLKPGGVYYNPPFDAVLKNQ